MTKYYIYEKLSIGTKKKKNDFLQFFPRWMAPNLITFMGFLLTIANFLLIGFYDYDFTAANSTQQVIPTWVWIVASVNIFAAYTLGRVSSVLIERCCLLIKPYTIFFVFSFRWYRWEASTSHWNKWPVGRTIWSWCGFLFCSAHTDLYVQHIWHERNVTNSNAFHYVEHIFEFLLNAFREIQYWRHVPAVGLRFYNVGTNCFAFIHMCNIPCCSNGRSRSFFGNPLNRNSNTFVSLGSYNNIDANWYIWYRYMENIFAIWTVDGNTLWDYFICQWNSQQSSLHRIPHRNVL